MKREAMKRVKDHANEEWLRVGAICLRRACERARAEGRDRIITDQVWFILDEMPEKTQQRKAMSAIMTQGAKEGLIRKSVGEFWPTERPKAHRGPKQVWIVL